VLRSVNCTGSHAAGHVVAAEIDDGGSVLARTMMVYGASASATSPQPTQAGGAANGIGHAGAGAG
jgi:hypothetical protein